MEKTVKMYGVYNGQEGFSLIELMFVIVMFGILVSIGMGSWTSTRTLTQVEGVVEEVKSAMSAARLKARATGQDQTVTLDYSAETMVTSVVGGTKQYTDVADLTAFTCGSCSTSATASETFTFTPRGTAGAASFRVQSKDGSITRYVVVSSTGRVRVAETCASGTCS